MLLIWLRHALPYRTIGVMFGLSKSSVGRILFEEVNGAAAQLHSYVNMNGFMNETPPTDFPTAYGILDGTEMEIQAWKDKAFSGKARTFTLKYQVMIGIATGTVYDIYGPCLGSVHDITMYIKSTLSDVISEAGVFILGDKGYIGAYNIITPHKKKDGAPLQQWQKNYNHRLAHYRITVENHFSHLKKWKILAHTYRGDIERHKFIVAACEVLLYLEQ